MSTKLLCQFLVLEAHLGTKLVTKWASGTKLWHYSLVLRSHLSTSEKYNEFKKNPIQIVLYFSNTHTIFYEFPKSHLFMRLDSPKMATLEVQNAWTSTPWMPKRVLQFQMIQFQELMVVLGESNDFLYHKSRSHQMECVTFWCYYLTHPCVVFSSFYTLNWLKASLRLWIHSAETYRLWILTHWL
jgi:hypothetical protein